MYREGGQKYLLSCDIAINFNAFQLILKISYLKSIEYTIMKMILMCSLMIYVIYRIFWILVCL